MWRRRKNTSRRRCASRELSLWSIPRLESPPRPPFVLASSLTFVPLSSQIRPGAIVVAEGETAILVKYELEGQLYAPDGVTVITEKSNSVKKIKVKTLNASTDLDALAAEIVEKCKLIHHSKTSHVRDLLAKLRDRDAPDARASSGTRRKGASHRSRTRHQRRARVGRVPSFVLVDGAFPIVVASLVRRMGRGGEGTRTPVESRRQYRCRFIFHPRGLARRVRLGRRRRRRRGDGAIARSRGALASLSPRRRRKARSTPTRACRFIFLSVRRTSRTWTITSSGCTMKTWR